MWISKKEWDNLKDKLLTYEEIKTIMNDMQSHNMCFYGSLTILKTEYYDSLTIKLNSYELLLKRMEEDKKYYKQLYLDELQKRLELANRVRKLEEK